jgi:fructose-1,6-bisphosphatase III
MCCATGRGPSKRRIDEVFGFTLSDQERKNLATIIYYPEQKIPLMMKEVDDAADWCRRTLLQLIKLCRIYSSKHTRSRVRNHHCPTTFTTSSKSCCYEQEGIKNRQDYFNSIIQSIIDTGQGRGYS